MLKINNLFKTYPGGKKAVQDLTIHVQPGELCGFIGHNGAGKTTALRCIAGVITYEHGSISIDGHDVSKDAVAAKRSLAFLPDNPDLYEYLSGIQYLSFIADIYGVSKDDREALITKYANAFELTSDLGSPISSYSHGMKQKLALISAFIHSPRLLVLDEPFVGLDPKASFVMKSIMRELCQSGGAVFFSTHVLDVAEKLCDTIAVIRGGQLVAAGPTAQIVGNSTLENVFLDLEQNRTVHAEVQL